MQPILKKYLLIHVLIDENDEEKYREHLNKISSFPDGMGGNIHITYSEDGIFETEEVKKKIGEFEKIRKNNKK